MRSLVTTVADIVGLLAIVAGLLVWFGIGPCLVAFGIGVLAISMKQAPRVKPKASADRVTP